MSQIEQINDNVFNVLKNDYENPSLFLGQSAGLFDTVNKKYPKIWDLYKLMKKLDWDANEFNYSSCNVEFKTCPSNTYDMMIRTLAWQWEADSVAARMVLPVAAPFISSTELLAAWSAVNTNECITGDHEVLTPTGWKRIDEVTLEDKVAQWQYNTKHISFVNPNEVIVKDYDGFIYNFNDDVGYIDQKTTANHRMPITYPVCSAESKIEYSTSESVKYDKSNILPACGFIINEHAKDFSDLDYLLILINCRNNALSEDDDGEHYLVSNISEMEKCALISLCEKVNYKCIKVKNETKDNFSLKIYVESKYVGKIETFSWIEFDKIDSSWIYKFQDCLIKLGKMQFFYSTDIYSHTCSNIECSFNIATLAHLNNTLAGFDVPEDGKIDTYISASYINGVSGAHIRKTKEKFTGKVYCLTVPTSYFLVRRNGAISVTGNCLHAETYSEIVRNSFDNPKDVLNDILSVTQSLQRLKTVSDSFSSIYKASHEYALGIRSNDQDTYNHAYLFSATMLILERIQFMASFAITFCICDTGQFAPIGKAVQKIAQDEFEVHVQINKAVIEYEHNTVRGQIAKDNCKQQISDMVNEVIESEFKWLDYMFSEGRELVGVNPDLLKKWVLFNAKDVINVFNLDTKYTLPATNPLKFMENWLNMGKTQPSPQEQANGQYKLNVMVRTDADVTFEPGF